MVKDGWLGSWLPCSIYSQCLVDFCSDHCKPFQSIIDQHQASFHHRLKILIIRYHHSPLYIHFTIIRWHQYPSSTVLNHHSPSINHSQPLLNYHWPSSTTAHPYPDTSRVTVDHHRWSRITVDPQPWEFQVEVQQALLLQRLEERKALESQVEAGRRWEKQLLPWRPRGGSAMAKAVGRR